MPEGAIPTKKAISIIVLTWIISLVTTLAVVYVAPNIFPIKTAQIADEAIITAKLADGTVTSAKILDGTIIAVDIADGSIITVKVADGAVTTAKIADGAVTTDKIADGAIVTVKMADGSVNSAKILNGAVAAVDLATGAVTEIKIADGAVTTSKIADYAVTNVKLAANAIPFNTTSSTVWLYKSTTSWENVTGMSVQITLERNSTLIIMFSTQAYATTTSVRIGWMAKVNDTTAEPGNVFSQPPNPASGWWTSEAFNFFANVTAGQYTVNMQWSVYGGANAQLGSRTLIVIALPE